MATYPRLDPNFLNQYMVEVEDGPDTRQQFTLPAARAHRAQYERPGLIGHLVRGARDVVPPTPWDPDKPRPELAGSQRSTTDKILDYGSMPAKAITGVFNPPLTPPQRPVTGSLPPTERSMWEDTEYANQLRRFGLDTGLNMIGAGRLPGASPAGAIGAGGGSPKLGSTVRNAAPIRAYHSSPHDFDRFDISKIGTGEGAQVYGHGLYFAENPKVSGQGGEYWQQFKNRFAYNPAEMEAVGVLENHNFDRAKAIEELRDSKRYDAGYIGGATNQFDRAKREAIVAKNHEALALLESGKPVGPRTYEVNINARPEQMLDWDKPSLLHQGSKKIEQVERAFGGTNINFDKASQLSMPRLLGEAAREMGSPQASSALREAGIPGIRYLDQGSRGATSADLDKARAHLARLEQQQQMRPGSVSSDALSTARINLQSLERAPPPTSNYVIFDPGIIEIAKKYGIPGMLGAGALGETVRRDKYGEPRT